MRDFFAQQLFANGYTDLISVFPASGQLTPSSKISAASAGKAPARRLSNGLYAGYDWRTLVATEGDVRQWIVEGSSIGLRADRFPALDIDCLDESIAQIIEDAALATLGAAPIRIGRAPKRLLMYRTDAPFSRMRLHIKRGGENHLVELLGLGQQYVVDGIHPYTQSSYKWTVEPPTADALHCINREQADAFFVYLKDLLTDIPNVAVEREGDGRNTTRATVADQLGLEAPDIEILREAVELIPNTNDLYPSREDYIKMGYAIKAAGLSEPEEAFQIFSRWATKWEGNGKSINTPESVRSDWQRMHPPYAIGWGYLRDVASGFGFKTAHLDFDVIAEAPISSDGIPAAPIYSDQWLADKVIHGQDTLRFVPQQGHWIAWDDGRWKPDAELLAEAIIVQELRKIADLVMRKGITPHEEKESLKTAVQICSAGKAAAVRGLMQSDRQVAVSVSALDADPWSLNTPNGIIDLRTGKHDAARPDALCTKSTAVVADFSAACPTWRRFLTEATAGDRQLELYLQRLCGYALTGSTQEQTLTFIHGPGGNGKSVFLNVLSGVLGDYAKVASMDTFTASSNDRHATEIAMLAGARLVSASETQAGKRWDEAKVKSLSGGEPVSARFMRQDFFTFTPQFKLVFVGNHKPSLREVDDAMRRRIQMVPFVVKPKKVDKLLGEKLKAEWPQILAWMVEGCLEWQVLGLAPPQSVLDSTDEYFKEEDAVGRWMLECLEIDVNATESSKLMYASWREWAGENGEHEGTLKRLSSALVARKLERWRDPNTRRMGFRGYRILDRQDLGIIE